MRLLLRQDVSSANASTHADNAEAAVMASADLMGGQQLGAESLDASDAENAPPRSSSCPPARGRQTSAVQLERRSSQRTAHFGVALQWGLAPAAGHLAAGARYLRLEVGP